MSFFLFSTSLLAKEGEICDWIITDGDYQEYLDDLPLLDFYSAFHVVVGNDGRCSYGWDWRQAVKKDKKKYITEYAKTNMHEDLAESFTAWLALRYKNDRISDLQKKLIENKIPNRITFFDEQQFDMYPLVLNN